MGQARSSAVRRRQGRRDRDQAALRAGRFRPQRGDRTPSRSRQENGQDQLADKVQPNTKGKITMRFLSIYKQQESKQPPSPELVEKMGKLIDEMKNAGTLIATEGCLPSTMGARVRISGDKFTVT